MMEVDLPRNVDEALVIQHDWHLALKEPISTFFIGVKPQNNRKTEFFDVQVTKLIDEFGFTVLPQKDGSESIARFGKISLDSLNNLHVNHNGIPTIFVSPIVELKIGGLKTSAHSIDVSSSGQAFVSADTSGNLVVSSAMDGSTMRILEGHVMDVYKCLYFPSGLIVLSGGMDLTVRVWAVDTGKCAVILKGPTQAITGVGIIGIGKEVVGCSNDGCAYKWVCGTGEVVEKWEFEHGKCLGLAVSSDSSRFAVLCENNFLSVIDCYGDETRRDIQLPSEPTCLVFSSNSSSDASDSDSANLVFLGFEDGHIAAYDVTEKKLIGEIVIDRGRVTCIKYFYNRLLVAFNDGRVAAYRMPNSPRSFNIGSGESKVPIGSQISAEYELTGADCDPIYDIAIHGRTVYTSCRDKLVRKYKLLWDC